METPITESELVCMPNVDPLKDMTDSMLARAIVSLLQENSKTKADTALFFSKELARRLEMKMFTFYWKDGSKNILEGNSPEDALNRDGFGGGAIRALDFHVKGTDFNYLWDREKKTWKRKNNENPDLLNPAPGS